MILYVGSLKEGKGPSYVCGVIFQKAGGIYIFLLFQKVQVVS